MVPFLRRRFVPNPFRDGTSSYELIFLRIFFALKKIGDGFLMGWIEGGGEAAGGRSSLVVFRVFDGSLAEAFFPSQNQQQPASRHSTRTR